MCALLAHFGPPPRVELPAVIGIGLLILGVQMAATAVMCDSAALVRLPSGDLFWANGALFLAAVPWLLDRTRPATGKQ